MAAALPLTVSWNGSRLDFLDQTVLPQEIRIETQRSVEQVWEAIRSLKVRGAPAIGIAAAYGVLVGLDPAHADSGEAFREEVTRRLAYLATARPTAVNLFWALERMRACLDAHPDASADRLYEALRREAEEIHSEDRAICRAIGEHGAPLIQEGASILTHCNAGALAVSELGTALAPIYTAHDAGIGLHVYVDETRPLLQGARLTSWELQQRGVPMTLLCDNMAAYLMSLGKVDVVIVGTDRVTANGDVINKIGTLGVAVLAGHFGVPFYVACPRSTLDLSTPRGSEVTIEQREPEEVSSIRGVEVAPEGTPVFNPAFDVTPAALVTGLITDYGLLTQPLAPAIADAVGGT